MYFTAETPASFEVERFEQLLGATLHRIRSGVTVEVRPQVWRRVGHTIVSQGIGVADQPPTAESPGLRQSADHE